MSNMLVNKYAKAKTGLDFARNVFTFKKGHKTNFLTGRIVPSIDPVEVLPGDSFNLSFAAVVRSAPLVAPVLDDLFIDVLAFWVPNRLVMNEFAQFLGENNTTAWTLKQDVDLPSLGTVNWPSGVSVGYLADHYLAPHFGFRMVKNTNYQFTNMNVPELFARGVLTLKSRGYDLIYNEWYRDENIIDPVLFSKESGVNVTLDVSLYQNALGIQRKACRLSDFWNKMLPAPQRGDAVGIDLLGFAPVVTADVNNSTHYPKGLSNQTDFDKYGLKWLPLDNLVGDGSDDPISGTGAMLGFGAASAGPSITGFDEGSGTSANAPIVPNNLVADLSNVSALTINQLRYAIMLQRFYEISARGGMREVEFYQAQFGVTSSDARFMRSELLTQKRYRINISQVINQAGSSDGTAETSINSALGSTGAYSVTGIKGHLFSKTFTEYGYIHIQHVIRSQPSISTGLDRSNFKTKFFDHFLPVFDHIGEQAYYNIELGSYNSINVFGYNEAWAEYRYQYSDSVGLFTPGEPLEYWTLSRKLVNPVLNQTFIEQGIQEFDRALIFPMIGTGTGRDSEGVLLDSNTYQWLIDFYVTGKMARTMSKDSTPGILGRI